MQNMLEGVLRGIRDDVLARHKQYCTCQQCLDDVLALALNHCRPKYVSGNRPMGNALTAVQVALDQSRAELTVVVFDAIRHVAANPRHPVKPKAHGE
jgi:competence protein ComFB